MNARLLVERMRAAGFDLLLDGETLAIQPASKLTDAQREHICRHRDMIVETLRLSEVALYDSGGHDQVVANDDPDALRRALVSLALGVCDHYGDGPVERGLMIDDLYHIPDELLGWHIGYFRERVAALGAGT